ncbi:hypothetical protein [Salinivirga cyanobacteriivorans]|uniref:Uncharacterized protein n=1 Tax=Salinivirga cyanobacteriivorans TaxID=1307839 RepID=A0A0S2HVR7_9BACT|nr:hypothetical protein [Salinivirga cyanobacteriivorans]ALO14143.1 hypothetical protein L21SP5_00467 [Salinivirga cyanobacteriivorans]
MKRQETLRRKAEAEFDRDKKIRDPRKSKKKPSRKVYQEIEEWDDYEEELARLRQKESLEDYFDDESED